jgi:hypothetical protein
MGTIEFKINGRKVGSIYFRNEGTISGDACMYVYEYYVPEEGVKKGKVSHNRSNGIEVLAYLILSNMRK